MIETRASKSFAEEPRCSHGAVSLCESRRDAPTQRGGYNVLTWLNLVCLDAPIVAVAWEWLLARSFGIEPARGGTAALFLTAWSIYLADRFGDSLAIPPDAPTSLRQRFTVRHRLAWIVALAATAVADLLVIAIMLERRMMLAGAVVGGLALVYLTTNQLRARVWQRWPIKEVSIGFLFAAGVVVPLAHAGTMLVFPAWMLLSCLCSLNCISVAVWERDLDKAQQRISIATTAPAVGRYLLGALLILASANIALGFAPISGRSVFLCVAMSAFLLGGVHLLRCAIQADVRTALADLALLTPLLSLPF